MPDENELAPLPDVSGQPDMVAGDDPIDYTDGGAFPGEAPIFRDDLYGEQPVETPAEVMDNIPTGQAGTLQPVNMQFDFSVFDRLAAGEVKFEELPEPVQSLAQAMTHLGIRPTSQDAARFVMQRQKAIEDRADPLYQARLRRAEADALKAENEAQGLGAKQGWETYVDPETGKKRMRIIPGGPAERAIRAQNKFTATAARTVVEDAKRAEDLIGFWSTGIPGAMTMFIPTTPARILDEHLGSVKSNVAVDQLLNIKKSGAGLGQVPQSQLEMLSELLGVLKVSLPADVLSYTLKRTRNIYEDIMASATEDDMKLLEQTIRPGQPQAAAQPATRPSAPPAGAVVDETVPPRKVLGRVIRKYNDGGWYTE
jgi:hypothetical protein